MKATDIFGHIDRLGMVARSNGGTASMFKLSTHVRLYLYDDESWTLRNSGGIDGTTDILDDEVFNAFEMSDQEPSYANRRRDNERKA
jgi:hypothetical protein